MRLSGLRAWWTQRASAVVMLLFVVFVLYRLGMHPMHGYAQWRGWVAQAPVSAAFAIFFVALLAHTWVGLRDVLLDYARPAGVRNGLLVLVALALLGLAAWLLAILVRLHA